MTKFFIVPQALYESTNWKASEFCCVGPVPIYTGPYAGSYAVNEAIFDSDPCFEPFRAILEPLTRAELLPENLSLEQE